MIERCGPSLVINWSMLMSSLIVCKCACIILIFRLIMSSLEGHYSKNIVLSESQDKSSKYIIRIYIQ